MITGDNPLTARSIAEEAGVAGCAQEADVRANVVPAAAAELAVIAIDRWFERGAVARRPAGDAGPGPHHCAGRFVPQHHGVDARRVAHGALCVGVQIGATDPHRAHADLHLARTGLFDRLLRQAERPRRGQFGNEHAFPY